MDYDKISSDISDVLLKYKVTEFGIDRPELGNIIIVKLPTSIQGHDKDLVLGDLRKAIPQEFVFKYELMAAHALNEEQVARLLEEREGVDVVNHPSHYNTGKIEVIEFIEDQKLNYHLGNCVKYICRAGKKDPAKMIEDLLKSQWYLKREIERLKAIEEARDPVKPNKMAKQ